MKKLLPWVGRSGAAGGDWIGAVRVVWYTVGWGACWCDDFFDPTARAMQAMEAVVDIRADMTSNEGQWIRFSNMPDRGGVGGC